MARRRDAGEERESSRARGARRMRRYMHVYTRACKHIHSAEIGIARRENRVKLKSSRPVAKDAARGAREVAWLARRAPSRARYVFLEAR